MLVRNIHLLFLFFLIGLFSLHGQEKCITTYAGNGEGGYNGDGIPATESKLNGPRDLAFDSDGNLYIVDEHNARIRKVDRQSGEMTTIAGTGIIGYNGDNIQATTANLNQPRGIAIDLQDNIYISERGSNRIRKVNSATGIITTVAGNGMSGFSGDNGQAVNANLSLPHGITVDSQGNIYISDTANHRIRKVNQTTGIITTYAGTGSSGYNGNGLATEIHVNEPKALALDADENVYIVEVGNHIVRKVSATTNQTEVVAGLPQNAGYNGDDIAADSALLNNPYGIEFDQQGNYYLADRDNQSIRKVDANTGLISTVVGTGIAGYNGDGQDPINAQLNKPHKCIVDDLGNLYIEDRYNERVRKVIFLPEVDLGEDIALCDWSELILDATPSNLESIENPIEYTWYLDGQMLENETGPILELENAGLYMVEVEAVPGCIVSDSVEIILGELEVDLGEDLVLCEESHQLSSDLSINSDEVVYSWAGPDGPIEGNNPSIVVDQTGEYSLTVSIGECQGTDSVYIELLDPPFLEMEDNLEFCSLETAFLDATPSNYSIDECSFEWALNGNPLPDTTAQLNLEEYGSGTYEVWVSLSDTDCTTYHKLEVVESFFEIELTADKPLTQVLNYCEADDIPEYEIEFTVEVFAADPSEAQFVWWVNDDEIFGENQTVFTWTYDTTGDFSDEIRVEVYMGDCVESAALNTFVQIETFDDPCKLTEGISPGNNDGLNDNFDLNFLAERTSIAEFIVYNRYGTIVYQENDYIDSWRGQDKNGRDLPSATYYYVIKFKNEDPVYGKVYKSWIYVNQES